MNNYPRTFSHIGISVPDVDKAVDFYSKVMGWYQIIKPTVITYAGKVLNAMLAGFGGHPIKAVDKG